jgi:hypothetical protein
MSIAFFFLFLWCLIASPGDRHHRRKRRRH